MKIDTIVFNNKFKLHSRQLCHKNLKDLQMTFSFETDCLWVRVQTSNTDSIRSLTVDSRQRDSRMAPR